MAELARWQWDDVGQWRDFAEQYQAEMEASFQRRAPSVEIAIPPYGTFRMDLRHMKQVTVKGRNPGYERDIRRQARKIEVGYFILGQEGEIYSSDSVLDKIEDEPVLDKLVKILSKIVEEPEDFGCRSVNLDEEDAIGECEEAVEFLKERGFELIEEGEARFLVFMQEDVSNLGEGKREAQARLERVRRKAQSSSSEATNVCSNLVESNQVCDYVAPAEDASQCSNAPAERTVFSNEAPSDSHAQSSSSQPSNRSSRRAKGEGGGGGRGSEGRGKKKYSPKETNNKAKNPDRFAGAGRSRDELRSPGPNEPLPVKLRLPTGALHELSFAPGEGTLDQLLEQVVKLSGLRLPLVQGPEQDKGAGITIGLAAEPGCTLSRAGGLRCGELLVVQDFEGKFVEKLQSGLLRLQDLAAIAPLLDWAKPELPKLLMGRMRSLLEGSCASWCQAASCDANEELLYGRALLRRVYGGRPLEERIEVCKRLLPSEKRDEKTVLKVKRSSYLASALGGLVKLSREDLRRPFAVEFEGETAEDHGGPRRDFFGNFGTRLPSELPALWNRLPKGALVPVADVIAESTPKSDRLGISEVEDVYRGCGRACALAARYSEVIGEEFAGFFLHQVARDDSVTLEELQRQLSEADGADIRASKVMLQKDLTELGLQGTTLSRVISNTQTEVELVPGGREMPVTEANKAEWLQLHLHDKLYGSLRKAADAFREGIIDVMGGSRHSCPLLVMLSPGELARCWAGVAVSDEHLRKWREVASVSPEIRQQADWLWELLEEGDEAFRGDVLKFATGIHRLGDAGLQSFEVQPADGGDQSLPRAMTCANMLQLPRYASKVILDTQLRKAIAFCDGFQIL